MLDNHIRMLNEKTKMYETDREVTFRNSMTHIPAMVNYAEDVIEYVYKNHVKMTPEQKALFDRCCEFLNTTIYFGQGYLWRQICILKYGRRLEDENFTE